MTREEAKDVLRNAAWLGSNADRERIEEAVRMAVVALNDKDIYVPNTDCISRKKTLERLTNISYNLCKTQAEDKIIEYAKTMVITMPSAQTKTQLSEEDTTSDTISRQQAVEVADAVWSATGDVNVAKVWDQINDLPSAQPKIVRCKDCVYYDPPHINDHGERREYKDMPAEAFDELGTGLVNMSYGINVGGRCLRDYNAGYSDDKRIFVPETNYCGRAERRVEHE